MTEAARRSQGWESPAVQQSSSTLADTLQLGEVLVASGFLPKAIRTKEQAATVILKGQELQLPPMQALSSIAVIDGKPTLSAELMVALVQRAGHTLRVVDTSSERAVVDGIRADDPNHTSRIEWTMEDAKRAGVAGKGPWKSYPDAMLRARAISALCRFAFADVLAGCSYVPEELGADVDGEGAVVEPPAPVATVGSREGAQASAQELTAQSAPESSKSERGSTLPNPLVTPQELRRAWQELPQASRPDWTGEVWPAYQRDPEAALQRLHELAGGGTDDAGTELDESGEAGGADPEQTPDTGSGPDGEPLSDDQYTYIHDIAEELYSEKSERYTGVQYLERDIGKALTTLTRDEANALIRSLDGQYKEMMANER